jgi:plasmid stabilization system protein ParE
MSTKLFRFHPEAKKEFREAILWYRDRNPNAATEFRVAVSGAVKEVAKTPHRWPKHLHGTRRFVLGRFPFSIVYLDAAEFVNIVAVAHSKRKPGYWKRRL